MYIIVAQTLNGQEVGLGPFERYIAEMVLSQLQAQNPDMEVSMIDYATTEKMGVYL